MTLAMGAILVNRYRVAALLGQGGFGAVYRGWDMTLSRHCAIKENFVVSEEAQRQFLREATVLANLTHPNLPRVNDHFVIPYQGQYLVMDYVDGEDLDKIIATRGAIDPTQAMDWITQVLDALVYLHSRTPPVLHRDIKPANIKITAEGKAMLVDFGLVKLYDPHLRTTAGARAITAGFSPPEQYGQAATDARSDIYSLGATLYMLLTGTPPMESVVRMAQDDLHEVHQLKPVVSLSLSKITSRAMEIRPTQRFQTAADFKLALTSITTKPASNKSKRTKKKSAVPPQPYTSTQVTTPAGTNVAAKSVKRPRKRWVLPVIFSTIAVIFIGSATGLLFRLVSNNNEPVLPPVFTQISSKFKETPVVDKNANASIKVCILGDELTDVETFQKHAWIGAQLAHEQYGVSISYIQLESTEADAYGLAVRKGLASDCTLILGTSYQWTETIQNYAGIYPKVKFAIIDCLIGPHPDNILDSWYEVSQPAYLSGWMAAGYSKTGVVATFGGKNIPAVIQFMHGFARGVQDYNNTYGTSVMVLGWNPESKSGMTNSGFTDVNLGYEITNTFVSSGKADVIFPIAAEVNVGALGFCQETENCVVIGTDLDGTLVYPEYDEIILTSVAKNLEVFVLEAARQVVMDEFNGGTWTGTLENAGVGLIHNLAFSARLDIKTYDELESLKQKIISNDINTSP